MSSFKLNENSFLTYQLNRHCQKIHIVRLINPFAIYLGEPTRVCHGTIFVNHQHRISYVKHQLELEDVREVFLTYKLRLYYTNI